MSSNKNRIFASVALFSELYDRNKDVYHLVGEFIKSAVITEKLSVFKPSEVADLLTKRFDFKLPVAVLRTVLKSRLKREGFCKSDGYDGFSIINPEKWSADQLDVEFERLRQNYEEILENLAQYTHNSITGGEHVDAAQLKEAFYKFLIGDAVGEEYSRICSAFIVENSSDSALTDSVNLIREGLVIYSGIASAQELNELGTWKNDLVIVLDTELLLDFGGFNGETYQEIFSDFHSLVNEVNLANNSKKIKARISLAYLEESAAEVDRIFTKAENVLAGRDSVQLTTTAYRNIIENCKTGSDVVSKRVIFFNRLKNEGIRQIDRLPLNETIPFNIGSQELLEQLPVYTKHGRGGRTYSEDEIVDRLRQFTTVNKLRSGVSASRFEGCGAVLLTRDWLTKNLSGNHNAKIHPSDYPFAIDIDHVVNRLWFNLNKGFHDKTILPKSFDAVTRAQIVLESQLRSAVFRRYSEILEKKENGLIAENDALLIFAEMRSKEIEAKEIDETALDEILEFITDGDVAAKIEELNEFKGKAAQLSSVQSELEETNRQLASARSHARRLATEKFSRLRRRNANSRRWVNRASFAIVVLIPVLLGAMIYLLVNALSSDSDTRLDFVLGIVGFVALLIPLLGYRKTVHRWTRRIINNAYRKRKNKLDRRGLFRRK